MLINLRDALMAGKRLPYDAEVEYLESTGTQWIDTGIVPSDSTGFIVDAMAISAVPNMRVLGVYETISGVQRRFAAVVRSDAVRGQEFYFGWGDAYTFKASKSNFMTRRVMELNFLNSRNMTFDGGVVRSNLPTLATITTSAWLFRNRGTTELAAQRIYRCQMSSGNKIVRDFIPVRKGTVGYLYDRVSGKLFGNAGTGDFVLGPDVVPVEYIESHGTEWIATGMAAQSFLEISIDAQAIAPLDTSGWFGARGGTGQSRHHFYINSSGVGGYAIGGSTQALAGFNPLARFKLSYSLPSATATVEGIGSLSFSYNFGSPNPNYTLFAYNNNGTIVPSKWRKYSFDASLYNSDTKIFLRPVRVGTEGAMMDVLTRRIYRNAGTGAFAYGNDLKYPIPAE